MSRVVIKMVTISAFYWSQPKGKMSVEDLGLDLGKELSGCLVGMAYASGWLQSIVDSTLPHAMSEPSE
jgi:hypothetical protein